MTRVEGGRVGGISTAMAVCFLVHDLSMSCDGQIVWVCDKVASHMQATERTVARFASAIQNFR